VDVIIYHNPDCGTSRNTLALIRNAGIEPHIVEYLKSPPSRAMLARLIARMGMPVREVVREKGTPYHELGLGNPALTDEDLLDAMVAHPVLINRPIVVTPLGVKLCRPSEAVLDPCQRARSEASSSRRTVSGSSMSMGVGLLRYELGRENTAAARRRGTRHRAAWRDGCKLRNPGRETRRRKCRHRASREHVADRRNPGRVDLKARGPVSGAHFNPAVSLVMGLSLWGWPTACAGERSATTPSRR
jgi:arsenate reductase (glutaredoxin)